jgi:hypothetical protein
MKYLVLRKCLQYELNNDFAQHLLYVMIFYSRLYYYFYINLKCMSFQVNKISRLVSI